MPWIARENIWPYFLGVLAFFFGWLYLNSESRKLRHIPTVGHSSPILSYISALKFIFYAKDMVNEGVDRFNGRAFKVPLLDRWMVVFHGESYAEDYKKAPDEALSINMAINESLQVPFTIGAEILSNPYHIPLIRTQLTRSLGDLFPEIYEEVVVGCSDLIPQIEEWKACHTMDTFLHIICRISNRTFVGLPLCRNSEYLEICKSFTLDIIKDSVLLNMLPSFLRQLSSYVINRTYRSIQKCKKHLEPVIASYREKKAAGYEMPVKMLTWLLEEGKGEEQSLTHLTKRILALNFTATHTTTFSFVQVLHNLVLIPNVENAIEGFGWSREALDNMNKVDSFIKETLRLTPLGIWQSSRLAMKDYTCLNGTFIPKGTMISLALILRTSMAKFNGFRFLKGDGEDTPSSLVTMRSDHLAFGIGNHSCPGRFFAAREMKLLLAHILMTYDLKLSGTKPPKTTMFGPAYIPDTKAKVMFRKRCT
ncbi:cytochrome P450 [Cyathus striatus]|nr:cytochrome P450 [Cyathus striatus]